MSLRSIGTFSALLPTGYYSGLAGVGARRCSDRRADFLSGLANTDHTSQGFE
jgi:hypothetical protein